MEHVSTLVNAEEYETRPLYSFTSVYFQERAKEICPNDNERRNIVLDLCYGDNNIKTSKDFCWLIIADEILKEKGIGVVNE